MLCEKCKKREATIHITEIINNKMTKTHLCTKCAEQEGMQLSYYKPDYSLADFLTGISGFAPSYVTKPELKKRCPQCKMTYNDFKKSGRLGCAKCYEVFQEELMPILKGVHGSLEHLGKTKIVSKAKGTHKSKKRDELQRLEHELKGAIEKEEYEKAAVIRDKIRELKTKGNM